MDLQHIENLVEAYAAASTTLVDRGRALEREIDRLHDQHLDKIRQAVNDVNDAEAALAAAIEAAPDLFERPKTRTLHGVKFGFRKQPGKVIVDDEATTVARIRKLLPEEQQELMIRVREAVHKPAVYDLTARDLQRLGITVTDDIDVVTIRPTESAVDRLINALRAEAKKRQEAQS